MSPNDPNGPLAGGTPIPVLARRPQAMPAEWDAHDATWLAWPHNVKDWPGKFAPIPWVYAQIVRQVAVVGEEPVDPEQEQARAKAAESVAFRGFRKVRYPT